MSNIDLTAKKNKNIGPNHDEPLPEGKSGFENFLSFPRTVVAPGASASIATSSQVLFTPRRLVIAPECAEHFVIHDIKTGNCSIFLNNADGAPASCFPPLPKDEKDLAFFAKLEAFLKIHVNKVQPSQVIALKVTNTSDKPQEFRAMFWGVMDLLG